MQWKWQHGKLFIRLFIYSSCCSFVTYVVTLGLTSGQEKILCGDLMFSGHTGVSRIDVDADDVTHYFQ